MAVEALLDDHVEVLANKAIEVALAGDGALLRALLSLVVTAQRSAVLFALQAIETAKDALHASAALATKLLLLIRD